MVYFFKFGIYENCYLMDDIYFMWKMVDIKRLNLSLIVKIKEDLKIKKIGVFLYIFYLELVEIIVFYLSNILFKIDIFILIKEDFVQILKSIFECIGNVQKIEV